MDNMELNLNELEDVSGGKNGGGFTRRPEDREGRSIYQIEKGDTLGKIARRNGTTVNDIMAVNPELKNKNYIVSGCYIYIPD